MRLALIMALAALLASPIAFAQSATTGSMEGIVWDSDGQPLPGATVSLASDVLLSDVATLTDEGGFFRIGGLPPGSYVVTASYGENVAETGGVIVEPSKTSSVNFNVSTSSYQE